MKKVILCLVTCLCVQKMFSGNNPVLEAAKNDIKRANATYAAMPNLSLDTYYMVYSDHTTQSLLEGKNGKYIKFGANYFTRIDDIETYVIGDKVIAINPDDQMISVGDNQAVVLPLAMYNIDSLLSLCKDIRSEQINDHERKYMLFLNHNEVGEFSRMDLHINTKSYQFTRLVLFYTMEINLKSDFYAEEKAPRLEITYKNLKSLKSQPEIFNPELYIHEEKGHLKPALRYRNYKLSDLRNQTRIKKNK